MSSVMTAFSGIPWGKEVPCTPVNPASAMGTWISMPWATATPCPAGACAACTTQWAITARGVGRDSTGMRWLPALLGSVPVRTAPGNSSLAAKILPAVKAEGGRGCPAGLGADGWSRLPPHVPDCPLLSCSTAILPQRYCGLQGLFLSLGALGDGECGSPRCQELNPSIPFPQSYPPAPCWDLRMILSPIACDCNPKGSDPRLEGCDPVTGQCHCLPHVTGRACGQCQPGYYGLEPAVGCKRYVGHSMGLQGSPRLRAPSPAFCIDCLLMTVHFSHQL